METTIAYDTSYRYSQILKAIHGETRRMESYLCKDGEPSINEKMEELLNKTIQNLYDTICQITVVLQCFDYEMEQYDRKPALSEEEKRDRETCRVLRWQLWKIEQSFRNTRIFLNSIRRRCKKYRFSANTEVLKAVIHACKNQDNRCKDCFRNVIMEYMLKSMLRPYYINLVNSGGNFRKDIREQVGDAYVETYEEHKQKYAPYIRRIAEFAEKSGNDTYRNIRKEEWGQIEERREQGAKRRKAEAAKKREHQYQERMEKFCREKEQSYHNRISVNGVNIPIISQALRHPDHTPEKKVCYYIACLIKPEKGAAYFRYLGRNGLCRLLSEIDEFFFDGEGVSKAVEACRSYPDVKAVGTVRVY